MNKNTRKRLIEVDEEDMKKVLQEAGLVRNRQKRKLSKSELETRRRFVAKLLMRDRTVEEICEAVGATEAEVRNDVKLIREQNVRLSADVKEAAEFLGGSLLLYKEIEAKAWEEFESAPPGSINRKNFLDVVKGARKDALSLQMDVGNIHKVAGPTVQIQKNVINTGTPRQNVKEYLDNLAKEIVNGHLKEPLPEPIPGRLLPQEKIIDLSLPTDEDEDENQFCLNDIVSRKTN